MRKTIYLPDALAARVDEYLKRHPKHSYSSLIQQILEREIVRPDCPSLLELAGLVDGAPESEPAGRAFGTVVPAEDPDALLKLIGLVSGATPRNVVPMDQLQPEDRFTDRDRCTPRAFDGLVEQVA